MAPKTKHFIVIANMKMNVIQDSYLQHYKNLSLTDDNYITVLMPPNPFIITLHNILGKDNVKYLGSQSIFSEKEGSYTGGTSIDMINNYISYVLVGHSERRMFFDENNTDIQKQLKLVIDSNLIPILAVGESSEDKNNNNFQSVIREQLSILNDIQTSNPIYIAYEPIWAIKNINPSLDVSLIYGGSVTENNIMDIYNIPNVNGVLVGGASADISKFSNILQKIKEAN